MKSIIKYLLISLTLMLFPFQSALAVNDSEIAQSANGTNVPIYRVYNPSSGEHLYTTSPEEVHAVVAAGWNDEGIGWYAPRDNQGEDVYRLFSLAAGEHLYTTDLNEVETLASRGWVKDFNGQPIFKSGGSNAIYRVYNANAGMHHLTTDANEYETLVANGWNGEGIKLYSAGQNFEQAYPLQSTNITNVNADAAIQTDVFLGGAGTGFHGKLLVQTPTAAVSFGLQYDAEGNGVYRNEAGFMFENVKSNNAGDQDYSWTGYGQLGKYYRLMLAYHKDGTVVAYVNGNEVGKVHNPNIANTNVTLSVEGSARKNGDSVDAVFDDIKLKGSGAYDANKVWEPNVSKTNTGIDVIRSGNRIEIKGAVTGLGNDQDWDNAYNSVSGVAQFPIQ